MKKITLLSLAILLFTSITKAQISKGAVLLGGSINASKGKTEYVSQSESTSKGISFYPSLGFTIKQNTVIGIRGGYGISKSEYNAASTNSENKTKNYSIGLFARKYLTLGKGFYLFGEGGTGYGLWKYDYVTSTEQNHQKSNSFYLSLYPGIAYAVNKRIHLEVSMNDLVYLSYAKNTSFISSNGTTQTDSKSHNFTFASNFSTSAPLSIGFRFVLGK